LIGTSPLMFYALLFITFVIAVLVSAVVVKIFDRPADRIFHRIIQDDIGSAWTTYLKFALYVVGISSGVRIDDIERYVIKPDYGNNPQVEVLTTQKWVLEIYRTVIDSLQGLAEVLLCFFVVSLIAFVFIRLIETIRKNREVKAADKAAS
jgi:peptidoglycan/LPS O-acetylase OafA/YrhL